MTPTFLDVALAFVMVGIILLVISHYPLGGQFAVGVLGSVILVILIDNQARVDAIVQGTLGRIGTAETAPAGNGTPSNGTVAG